MSLRDDIIQLGHDLAEEQNMAYQLWTWLPSYKEAQKLHGDYASNFIPSIYDIMEEAATVLAEAEGK